VILAHLGNGASITAVHGGRSMDTTMSFTPTAGLPMSTRSGDLDPSLAWYLYKVENVSAEQFHDMVNHESGLLGVSETSSDMRELLEREKTDVRAAEALAMFCYQARKFICSMAGAMEGVDTLVFSGGIGEKDVKARERICAGLAFLGIELDEQQNQASAGVISKKDGRVTVRVIHTDEELVIAKTVCRFLDSP
jgi:acetate kinase